MPLSAKIWGLSISYRVKDARGETSTFADVLATGSEVIDWPPHWFPDVFSLVVAGVIGWNNEKNDWKFNLKLCTAIPRATSYYISPVTFFPPVGFTRTAVKLFGLRFGLVVLKINRTTCYGFVFKPFPLVWFSCWTESNHQTEPRTSLRFP